MKRTKTISDLNAAKSGTFTIGGDAKVHRLGYGAMRITGRGIWGEPADRAEAIRTLKRLPELGINFIDTADAYGPDVSEQLIREALHPYGDILVATKGGFARTGPDQWVPLGRAEYLVQQVTRACVNSGSNKSAYGSFIASTRKRRGTSSLPPSSRSWRAASSVTRA